LSDNEEGEGRTINVNVIKKDEGSDKEELERLQQLLIDLAEKALEEKKEEIKARVDKAEWDEIDGMGGFELDGYVSGLEKSRGRKISSGVVKLRQFRGESPEFSEDEDGRKRWAHYLMDARNDPNNPYYAEVNALFKEAKSDKELLQYIPRNIDFSEVTTPAVRDLGEKFTFKQYTEWIQKKAREQARNAK